MAFVTALILRLAHILEVSKTRSFYEELVIDAKSYDTWGWAIAGGDIIGSGVFYQDPLYPYFLGLIYSIFGHNLSSVLIIQAIIGAASTVLVFLIGSRTLNKPVGLIAAALWAFHPPIIFYEGLIMKEGLVVFLILITIYFLVIAGQLKKSKYWCFSGITLGLTALARGNILLFVPFVVLWQVLEDKKAFWKSSFALLISIFAVLIPVAIRNKVVGGEFVLTTSQAGANFYWGNNENSSGTLLTSPAFVRSRPPYEKEDFANEAMRLSGRAMRDTEISRFWFKKGIEFIIKKPKQYFRLQYQKLQLLFNDTEISDNYQYYYYRKFSTLLKYSPISFGLICSFGLLGMVLSVRNWRRLLPLNLFVISYCLSLILFIISTRYRLPVVPFLSIFAAITLQWIWKKLSTKEFSSVGYGIAFIAIFSFFVWKDIPWLTHWNKVDVMAREGFELFSKGELDTATSKFKEVVKLSPLDYDGHLGLGEIYYKGKKYLQAIDEFKIALQERPSSAVLYSKIGLSYVYAGEIDEGIKALYKSVELNPNQPSVYFALSIAFEGKGLHSESQRYLAEFKKHKAEVADYW